jgi:hypothetical protein
MENNPKENEPKENNPKNNTKSSGGIFKDSQIRKGVRERKVIPGKPVGPAAGNYHGASDPQQFSGRNRPG